MAVDVNEKGRYFIGIVYPDSAPTDWKKRLDDSMGMYAISPLHSADGKHAKPHYHVVYKHDASVTLRAAKRAMPEGIFANDRIEICHHARNYQRYLIHLDNPEKEQFEGGRSAIETLNNFPLNLGRDLTDDDIRAIKKAVFSFIRDKDIVEYCDLLDALEDVDDEMWDYASNHTIQLNTYLASRRNKIKDAIARNRAD